MNEKNEFEEKLLAELRQVASERPEPAEQRGRQTWRPRAFALGGSGLAIAVAAAAIFAGSGGNTTSAYAVEKQPDGAVKVRINSLDDADGLENRLREEGIPAVVDFAPAATLTCVPMEVELRDLDSVPAERVEPEAVEAGETEAAVPSDAIKRAKPIDVVKASQAGVDVKIPTTEAMPAAEAISFTIEPSEIKQGEKLYVTKPAKTGAAGIAATISEESEVPGC